MLDFIGFMRNTLKGGVTSRVPSFICILIFLFVFACMQMTIHIQQPLNSQSQSQKKKKGMTLCVTSWTREHNEVKKLLYAVVKCLTAPLTWIRTTTLVFEKNRRNKCTRQRSVKCIPCSALNVRNPTHYQTNDQVDATHTYRFFIYLHNVIRQVLHVPKWWSVRWRRQPRLPRQRESRAHPTPLMPWARLSTLHTATDYVGDSKHTAQALVHHLKTASLGLYYCAAWKNVY